MRSSWAKKASSLPSDRIKSSNARSQQVSSKVKGKQPVPEPPKSKEVRRLESLLDSVQNSVGSEKDPKGGCFCLAREHPVSTYTPICFSCGFILCSINLPQYSCPSCSKPLWTNAQRSSIISQIDGELAARLAKEIADAERAAEEAKKAAGAFPVLSSAITSFPSPSPSPAPTPPNNKPSTYKVMSLTQKGKNNKVVVSSYTSTPQPSPPSRAESPAEPESVRVPPPPDEVAYAKTRPDPARPWENLIGGGATYVPLARLDDEMDGRDDEEGGSNTRSRRRRKNKGKATEDEGGGVARGSGNVTPFCQECECPDAIDPLGS